MSATVQVGHQLFASPAGPLTSLAGPFANPAGLGRSTSACLGPDARLGEWRWRGWPRRDTQGWRVAMPGRMRRKADLPTKVCVVCNRPFTWRRKWAAVWDEVRYCSDACRRARPAAGAAKPAGERG